MCSYASHQVKLACGFARAGRMIPLADFWHVVRALVLHLSKLAKVSIAQGTCSHTQDCPKRAKPRGLNLSSHVLHNSRESTSWMLFCPHRISSLPQNSLLEGGAHAQDGGAGPPHQAPCLQTCAASASDSSTSVRVLSLGGLETAPKKGFEVVGSCVLQNVTTSCPG